MSVALFDLDRTLIDVNSGQLWVRNEWREGNIGMRQAVWAAWWLMRYRLGRVDGLDGVFEAAAKAVEGESEEAVADRVQRWFDREVRHHLRPGGRDALDRHRAAGDRIVLATSGTLYAARAAAAAYHIDEIVCTTLEVADGVFTGRVDVLAVGRGKLDAVRGWADDNGVELEDCTFYTDSYADVTLMERVGEPVAINPDRALRRRALTEGWRVEDWGRAAGSS